MSDGKVHSQIGASSYYRWRECPGSVRLCKDVPNISSVYAEEGTKAHELAASVLEMGEWPKTFDEEMGEAVQVYVQAVIDDVESISFPRVYIEHKFDLSAIHPGLYGTADCVIYDEVKKHLIVYDYKHGAGIPVDVANNDQLMYYGLGALLSLGIACEKVTLKIAQPRCYHKDGPVREWSFLPIEILDYAADLKENAMKIRNKQRS